MRVAFFSGSEISIPFLESILDDVILVVTLMPKVRGRGNKLTFNPIKTYADSKNISIIEVGNFSSHINQEILLYSFDAIVVGGGPIGLRVARNLAKSNVKVLVLEAKTRIGYPNHCSGLVPVEFIALAKSQNKLF